MSVKIRESNLSSIVKRATQPKGSYQTISTQLREHHDQSSVSNIEQVEKRTSTSLDS